MHQPIGCEFRTSQDHGVWACDGDHRVLVGIGTLVLWGLADPGDRGRVVEADAQCLLHVHGAANARDPSHDVRSPVTARHQVDDGDLSGLRDPPGLEHEGAVVVVARLGSRRPDRRDAPVTLFGIAEQRAEGRARVESG